MTDPLNKSIKNRFEKEALTSDQLHQLMCLQESLNSEMSASNSSTLNTAAEKKGNASSKLEWLKNRAFLPALVASLLECDFSYRHANENILSGESVPIIECDQIDIEKTGPLPYQAMINKFGSINICYIVESFETIQTDFLQSFANTNSNFFLIYNKKHPHLERFLRDDFVELISAVYCRLEEKNTLITKSEEIRAQLSKTYSGLP